MCAMQVPRLRAKTACLLFREQFDTLVKDTKSALEVIATAVHQVCTCTFGFPVGLKTAFAPYD